MAAPFAPPAPPGSGPACRRSPTAAPTRCGSSRWRTRARRHPRRLLLALRGSAGAAARDPRCLGTSRDRRRASTRRAAGGDPRTKARRAGALTLSEELLPVDLAVRDWARRDPAVAQRLRRVDNRRMRLSARPVPRDRRRRAGDRGPVAAGVLAADRKPSDHRRPRIRESRAGPRPRRPVAARIAGRWILTDAIIGPCSPFARTASCATPIFRRSHRQLGSVPTSARSAPTASRACCTTCARTAAAASRPGRSARARPGGPGPGSRTIRPTPSAGAARYSREEIARLTERLRDVPPAQR